MRLLRVITSLSVLGLFPFMVVAQDAEAPRVESSVEANQFNCGDYSIVASFTETDQVASLPYEAMASVDTTSTDNVIRSSVDLKAGKAETELIFSLCPANPNGTIYEFEGTAGFSIRDTVKFYPRLDGNLNTTVVLFRLMGSSSGFAPRFMFDESIKFSEFIDLDFFLEQDYTLLIDDQNLGPHDLEIMSKISGPFPGFVPNDVEDYNRGISFAIDDQSGNFYCASKSGVLPGCKKKLNLAFLNGMATDADDAVAQMLFVTSWLSTEFPEIDDGILVGRHEPHLLYNQADDFGVLDFAQVLIQLDLLGTLPEDFYKWKKALLENSISQAVEEELLQFFIGQTEQLRLRLNGYIEDNQNGRGLIKEIEDLRDQSLALISDEFTETVFINYSQGNLHFSFLDILLAEQGIQNASAIGIAVPGPAPTFVRTFGYVTTQEDSVIGGARLLDVDNIILPSTTENGSTGPCGSPICWRGHSLQTDYLADGTESRKELTAIFRTLADPYFEEAVD